MKVWTKSSVSVGSDAANLSRRRARRRQQHRRHAEAAHRNFPEIENGCAEQQRHQQIEQFAPFGPDRALRPARLITQVAPASQAAITIIQKPIRAEPATSGSCSRTSEVAPARMPPPMPTAADRSSAIQAASTNSTPAPAAACQIGCDSSELACGASGSRNASQNGARGRPESRAGACAHPSMRSHAPGDAAFDQTDETDQARRRAPRRRPAPPRAARSARNRSRPGAARRCRLPRRSAIRRRWRRPARS